MVSTVQIEKKKNNEKKPAPTSRRFYQVSEEVPKKKRTVSTIRKRKKENNKKLGTCLKIIPPSKQRGLKKIKKLVNKEVNTVKRKEKKKRK